MRSHITRHGWSGLGVLALALVTSACAQTDPGIESAVQARLAADELVPAEEISVEVQDGVVTLHGAVDTQGARARALEIARETRGVRDVVDELRMTPGVAATTGTDDPEEGIRTTDPQWRDGEGAEQRAGDAAVTTAVRTSLMEDTSLSELSILVSTRENVVTLTGRVPSLTEKHRAIELARETEGVKSVVDRLRVDPELDK
jgi:hyperosmotically inducible periplasmic protein